MDQNHTIIRRLTGSPEKSMNLMSKTNLWRKIGDNDLIQTLLVFKLFVEVALFLLETLPIRQSIKGLLTKPDSDQ